MYKSCLLVVLALALTTTAFAYPTLAGPTGGLNAPTAAVQEVGQFSAALDWIDTDPDSALALRVLFGLAPGLEVGASYFDVGDENDWNVNAKYALPLALLGSNWAVGALYQRDADLFQAYVAATRGFTPLITGTLGAIYSDLDGATDTLGFVNVEVGVAELVVVGGEYFFGGDADDTGNAYVRLSLSDRFSVQAGMQGLFAGGVDNVANLGVLVRF